MTDKNHQYAGVVLNLPLDIVFTYKIPNALMPDRIFPGCRVQVPFRNRKVEGYVTTTLVKPPEGIKRVLEISSLVNSEPLISSSLLSLAEWMSGFYCASLGEILEAIGPPKKKKINDIFEISLLLSPNEVSEVVEKIAVRSKKQASVLRYLMENGNSSHLAINKDCGADLSVLRRMAVKGFVSMHSTLSEYLSQSSAHSTNSRPPELNAAQQNAVDAVVDNYLAKRFKTFLLHGVTGSGKTEVYLRIISHIVAHGGQAIVLVPEIS